ncbi:hypothetical protein, partial [Paraburkholderia sp. SIMBA_054]|uniref:hypothetical protein n=1 Tax=Paraburkholderia sp. SIMBA_054 TaxID=3085795 RepID=UPI00397D78AC
LENTASEYSLLELRDRIAIERPDNSRVLNIAVSAGDKNEAAAIANALAFSLQEEVTNLLKVDNVSVILTAGTSDDALNENSSLSVQLSL